MVGFQARVQGKCSCSFCYENLVGQSVNQHCCLNTRCAQGPLHT